VSGLRIGVVVPAYNAGLWIHRCLRSLIDQSFGQWWAVVVDDGSADTTGDEVSQFADPRIRLIRQKNAGVSAARNRGIDMLPGCDAVLFLDADDWLAPEALQRLADALHRSPHAVAATGPAAFVTPDGSVQSIKPGQHGDILERLLVRNLFINGGHLLIRRDAVSRAGRFIETLRFGEDWEYWVRIALLGPFVHADGAAPVLLVRRLESGAYWRMARDPASFRPCVDAVFGQPAVLARLGERRAAALRARAEAEAAWAVGRALLADAAFGEGRVFLRRSVRRYPSFKRLALLAAAYCPAAWRAIAA